MSTLTPRSPPPLWVVPPADVTAATVHADDAAASPGAAPEQSQAKGTFNPVVFSRKETFSGPDGEYEEGQSSKRQATEGILSRLPAAPRLAPVG